MQAGAVQIRLVADIMDLQSKMQKAQSIVDNAAGSISKALGAAFAGFSAASFVTKLIDVQRQFDVLNSSLITVTGSSTKAAQEFAWIKQFAATTPYQLNEVTSAFVKMKALGLDASQKALTSYGNTASAMGKGLNQMVEAVADAATGEFERLKEFGIKAKKEGDQVALTFRGTTTTIGNSAKEITGYLQKIGDVDFAGAMATRAATLDGAISNLADSWDALFLTVSQQDAGGLIYDSVTLASSAITDATNIIKSMSGAASENARSTGAMATVQEALAVVFETVAVVGANVMYVLTQVGNEMGGMAAQAVQILQGNFAGAAEIRRSMVADAEAARREIDATTDRILGARNAAKELAAWNTRNASASSDPRRLDADTPARTAAVTAAKTKLSAAQKEVNAGMALFNDLMAKESGYSKTFTEDVTKLAAAYQRTGMSTQEYTTALAALLAAQPGAIDAAKLNTEAVDELFDAQEKLRQANEDQIKTGRTMLEQIEFETRLLGLNAEQRAVATMERELESQGIVKGTQAYDAYIIKLREAMALKSAKEAGIESTKELADANKKAAEKSSKYWEDALMRAFESGKGFFESLWDTIKNTLKTQVLKVLVTGVIGGTSGIASAATGANVLTSAAGSLASGVSGIGTGIMNGIGTFAAANLGVGGLALQGTLATIAEQGLISGFTSAMTSASTLAGAGSFAGAIGAAAPYLLPGIALLSMVGNKRAPSAGTGEGNIQYDAAGNAVSQSSRFTGAWGLTDDVAQSIGGLSAAYMASAASLGIGTVAAQFGYGGNTGKEGKDPQFAIGVNAGGAAYNSGEMQLNEANVQLAASRAVFAALQGSDLPKYLEGVFDSLTASTATQEQISATMAYAAQLKAVRDSLTETREPLQILQDQVTAGTAALATSAATFKTDFVAAIDAGMNATKLAQWQALGGALDQLAANAAETAAAAEAAAQKMAEAAARLQAEIDSAQFDAMSAYMSAQADYAALVAQEQDAAAQAMEQAATASAQAAEAIRSAMASAGQGITALIRELSTTVGGTLDPMALMRSTQRAYLDDLRLAQAGDVQASGRVAGSARAYLDASGAVSANNRQAATVAQVVAELGKLPAVKTYEQQLLEAVQGTTTAVNTSSATNAATIAAALATKLTAQLSVDANSQIFKLISFLATTDDIPAELKDLALKAATEAQRTINLVTSTTLLTEAEKQAILAITTTGTKNISLALANDAITEQFQTAVLAATISTTKNVGLVAAYASAADRQTIIGAGESVTKLVSAALANADPAAMAIALAQSSVLERMLKASGGVLTDDQRALIDGIATYNKTIVFNAVVDSAAMQAVKAAYEKLAADVAKTGVTAGAGTTITVGNTTTTTTGTVSPGMTPEQIAAAAQATLYTRIRDLYDSIDKTVVASKTDAYTQRWGAIELAKQLKSVGATMRDVASARSQSYESVLAGFAAFGILPFDQGTNYLPYDQVAMVHKGERIIPAADNRELMQRLQSPQANSEAMASGLRAVVAELAAVRAELAQVKSEARQGIAHQADSADTLRKLKNNGVQVWTDPAEPITTQAAP